jgi:hypothetical protein
MQHRKNLKNKLKSNIFIKDTNFFCWKAFAADV